VNITSGSIDSGFNANSGSEVNIRGGTVGFGFNANSGSEVNICGGILGRFQVFDGSTVNITGGTIGRFNVGGDFDVIAGQVNLFGSEFFINGLELDSLQLGQAVTITQRDVVLSGTFSDGELFSFPLNSVPPLSSRFFFSPDATLTVTLTVPFVLGDCNQDGVVNFEDISSFIMFLTSDSFLKEADVNQDNIVDFSDIAPFIAILIGS